MYTRAACVRPRHTLILIALLPPPASFVGSPLLRNPPALRRHRPEASEASLEHWSGAEMRNTIQAKRGKVRRLRRRLREPF